MAATGTCTALRRATGILFVVGAVAFAAASTVLSSTFDWPDILREPSADVLPAFESGGKALVWTWFATAWTYGLLLVPILLLPAALGRRHDAALRAATYLGATSIVLSVIGFLRWVFVVRPLADSFVGGDAVTQAAVTAAWTAQHHFGGALLGEHLGQLFAVAWSATVSALVVRTGALPRWLGVAGLLASGVYLLNQGDILGTAIPGFPVWDLAGLLGSALWGLWILGLGVLLLRRSEAATSPSA
jgi:drug/metabolite transporter (DMT)-like permease